MRSFDKPWLKNDADFPSEIFEVKAMIGNNERKMLYSFARWGLEGLGQVVDGGAFIGGSCLCLASGLASSGLDRGIFVHSFDLFSAQAEDVIRAIEKMIRPTSRGDGYLDIFNKQTEKYADFIKVYPGDLLEQKWAGEPIEILFIDICKSPDLNAFVVENFMTALIPEKSIIIQQDFLHVWHPYIQWTMELLKPYFEIEASLVDASRVYRLKTEIPRSEIARITGGLVAPDEKVYHLKRLGVDAPQWQETLSDVLVLRQLFIDEQWDKFDDEWAAYYNKYGDKLNSSEHQHWLLREGKKIYDRMIPLRMPVARQ